MTISNKTRYGLQAVVFLGLKHSISSVSIKEISEKQEISKRYLEQIFSELKRGGIVKSIKGTKGGYFLSKHPKDITVAEVITLLEGGLSIVENVDKVYPPEDIEYTLINNVWREIEKAIIMVASKMTIEDLCQQYHQISNRMFYI